MTTVTQSSSSSNFQSFKNFQGNCQKSSWINTPAVQVPPQKSNGSPTAKATLPSSPSTSSSSFEQAVLGEHNRLRARHSAQPLKLNPAISRYAQEWANNLAARNTMQHRSNNKYGENLYASFGRSTIAGEDAVKSWYDEIKYYKFGQPSPGNFSQVGHFTQVVWKESRELGVGMARNGNNIYVVCNYDPPGNFTGKYAPNVTKC